MKYRMSGLLFVVLCGCAPAVLGSLLNWPTLLWAFMSMVTASGSLLLLLTVLTGDYTGASPYESAETEPESPPEEPPYLETRVFDAPLPSAVDGYEFLFSATVLWRATPEHVESSDGVSRALAEASIVDRAAEIVRCEDPGRADFARYLLDGALGVPLTDRSGRVTALAADLTLTLAPADRARLRRLSDLRKDEEVWEYERQRERNRRQYLGDDVLKSTGSAMVWWLARHEDEIERAVEMIGPLAQVSAAANDEEVPELFRHLLVPPVEAHSGGPWQEGTGSGRGMSDREEELSVPDRLHLLLTALGLEPGTDAYTVFVHRVVRSLKAAGLHEPAEEIERTLLGQPDEKTDEDPSMDEDGPDAWSPTFTASEHPSPTEAATTPFTPGQADRDAGEGNRSHEGAEDHSSPSPL